MNCGFETPAEFAQCAILAKEFLAAVRPWIELGLSLLGIGTVGLLAVLTWVLRKQRKDIDGLKSTEEALRSASKRAMEAQAEAEARAVCSEQNLVRALDELSLVRAPMDTQLAEATSTIATLRSKLASVRNASRDNTEFWSREPDTARRLPDYIGRLNRSIPVLLFANQKGGVGKTTLVTNVAACFAERGERVLVIDLDYQGSATSLMLAQANERPQEFPSMVDLLHGEPLNALWYGTAIKTAHPNLDYVSCWYSFEKLERSMEYQWALDDVNDDIRFRLARAVLSDHVQTTYARVLIDAPPRMTAGFMNGFCASTHLFVPMVVDRVSAIAVGTFARRYKELVPRVNPALRFAGIVWTMTIRRHLTADAEPVANTAEKDVRAIIGTNDNYFMRNGLMEHTPKISYSTEAGVAYLQRPATRPMFDAIADEIARRAPRAEDSKQ